MRTPTPAPGHRPYDPWDADAAAAIAAGLRGLDGPLLPILHALQERFGYIDERAVPIVADVLNLSRAEVHGVVGFYPDFRRAPPGRCVVRLCRAEACQAMGADRLAETLESALGTAGGATSPDGRVTLETAYCLGNCALSPAALIDGKLYGRVDADAVAALVRERAR
ncbi:MAG: formate dehydrogenase subunit gamma [Rhodospirillales bacterium]